MKKLTSFLLVFLFTSFAVAANHCNPNIPDHVGFKFDYFPGIKKKIAPHNAFEEQIDAEVPNFREMGTDPVYGTAQPTVNGAKEILEQLSDHGRNKVLWVNLREEPILYFNGLPYVLRDLDHPFQNLMHVSATAKDTVKTEECLKSDILKEAKDNNGDILVYDEDEKGNVVEKTIKLESAQTVSAVFKDFNHQGIKVQFERVPLTDEKAPTSAQTEELAKLFEKMDSRHETALVANCHMGRGRTTTALTLYYITKGNDVDSAIEHTNELLDLNKAQTSEKTEEKRAEAVKRIQVLKDFQEFQAAKSPE